MNNKIYSFVKNYYEFLDSNACLNELLVFFYEKDFQIIEGKMLIDSFEKYSLWYENVSKVFLQKKHIIRHLNIEEKDSFIDIQIDMDFEATKASGESIKIENAKITWQVININNELKIKKYEINI